MSFSFIKTKWFLAVVIIGLIGAGLYVRSTQTKKTPEKIAMVKQESIEETLEIPGRVDAKTKAELKFLAGGKLVSLPVAEGQEVKKGSKIASIDAADLQKNLESSLKDYSSTRADFDQGIDDRKDKALSDSLRRVSDKLQNTLDKSVISVELRDIALKNATLVSPINGVVTQLPVDTAGVQVTAADTFEITDPNSLIFEAEVDEVDIGRVRFATPVRVVLDAYPDEHLDGIISYIGMKARTSTKSSGGTIFPVRVSIPADQFSKFRLGMNGTMTIILAHKDNVLTVPIEATSEANGKTVVKVQSADGKTITETQITTGLEGPTTLEVLSGLREGDRIVLPQ